MGGVRRALVVAGAMVGVALLCAPVASADGPVEVRTRLNGFCLERGYIYPCNGTYAQQWVFDPDGKFHTHYGGLCLFQGLGDPQNGAELGLGRCAYRNPPGATWTRQPNGQITNGLGGCLAVGRGGSTAPDTPVIVFHCTANTPGQEWDIAPL